MPVGAGTPVIPQAQLDLGPAAWWRPEADSPPANRVVVKAGYAFAGAYETVDKQTDQLTAGFAGVSSGAGFKRYDMVYIDAAGSALIAQGRDVAVANPLFDGAPGRANGPPMPIGSPVAYVLVTEAAAVVVDITDVYQINGFVPLQRDLDGFVVDKGTFSAAALPAPTGSSDVVTLIFASETRLPSGVAPAEPNSGGSATQAGVVTAPPLNYIWLINQNGDEIIHTATGAKVYGRLTEAGGVWMLAYHYIDATGAEQSVTAIETDCTVTPSAFTKLVGVPKVFSRHDPNRPLFDSAVSRLVDQIVGDIPYATETRPGKVQLAGDGDVAAGEVVQGNDSRLAGQRGRANAGAILGPAPITRMIQGAGISVSLVLSGGELQFTITNTSPGIPVAPGGFAFSWSGGVGNSGALPFRPIGAMATGQTDTFWTASVGGAVGTAVNQQVWMTVNTLAPGTNASTGAILIGCPVIQFAQSNVRIGGTGTGTCIIWGV